MDERAVPSALADVAGPLREADEYARLQAIRQRGLYNILTGLPGFLLIGTWLVPALLARWLGETAPLGPAVTVAQVVLWILFALSCSPQRLLMPWVRRHRPDWQSPLLDSSLLKRALEKQFWFQFPFWMAYFLLLPLLLVLFLLRAFHGQHGSSVILWSAVAGLVLHVAAVATLAWQAGRTNDGPLRWLFLGTMPLGVVALAFQDQAPSLIGMLMLTIALVVPPMAMGLVRLLAPRRWLIR